MIWASGYDSLECGKLSKNLKILRLCLHILLPFVAFFSKRLRYTVFPYYARNLCFIDSLKTRTADLRILRNFLIDSTISFYNIVQLLQCTQCCTVLLNHVYEITYIFLSIFKIKNIGYLKSIDILAKLFKIYFFRSKKLFLRLYRKKSI